MNKRGRPSLGLNNRMTVMVTNNMQEVVQEKAKAAGLTVGEWLRQAIAEKVEAAHAKPWKDIETRDAE